MADIVPAYNGLERQGALKLELRVYEFVDDTVHAEPDGLLTLFLLAEACCVVHEVMLHVSNIKPEGCHL